MDADVRKRRTHAALLFLLSLVASAPMLERVPLAALGGLADEWFSLGVNLARNGTLGWGAEPMVLRPPGYPAFIAAVLHVGFGDIARLTPARLHLAERFVYLAQALVLASTTALLYYWLRRRVSATAAAAAACAFGVNPYSLLLVTLLHYDLLHLFGVVALMAALERAIDREPWSAVGFFGCGVLAGLATLVRPLTLLLPPLLLLGLMARRGGGWRRAAVPVGLFTLGLGLAVAPWTARNYAVSGRLIPTNAQGWTVVWGSTLAPLELDPNRYQWRDVVIGRDEHIFAAITGKPEYDYWAFLKHLHEIQAAHRAEALRNIRERPGIYLRNVARTLVTLHFQVNSALASVFLQAQQPGGQIGQDWFWGESHPRRAPTGASRAIDSLFALLTGLALLGAFAAVRTRDGFALAPALLWICFAGAHAITYMDFTYYYLKLPFLAVFAALGLARLESGPAAARTAARVLAGLIVATCAIGVGLLLS
jgi:hypothetical protein